jgi:glyoxalase/bleomycin resistance protein/dioxygenase superfamily protein
MAGQEIDLDHFAIALRDVTETLNTLVGELGSRVLFGGGGASGFRAMQLDCGDLSIELLEPHNIENNDFLQRFLDRSGEGPHHMTFKTPDIKRELERAAEAGYHPVGVNIDNPWWKEAFIHPKEAGGTVVQLAESAFERDDIDPEFIESVVSSEEGQNYGPGQWWTDPPEPGAERAVLRRVVVATEEIGRALGLYETLLEGDVSEHGEGWVELGWPGGGKVRLELAAGRAEGVDRLEWTHAGQHEERTVGGTRFVLYPGD